MNRFLLILTLVFLTISTSYSQSQQEMNREARESFEKVDAQLNKIYQKVLADSDDERQLKLKAAQRAWVVLRDAEADLAADDEARGGSLAPLIYSCTQTSLTEERIAYFKKILQSKDQ